MPRGDIRPVCKSDRKVLIQEQVTRHKWKVTSNRFKVRIECTSAPVHWCIGLVLVLVVCTRFGQRSSVIGVAILPITDY